MGRRRKGRKRGRGGASRMGAGAPLRGPRSSCQAWPCVSGGADEGGVMKAILAGLAVAAAMAGAAQAADGRGALLAHFLETGVRPNGSSPRPPMPAYRMQPGDARAVAAYIRSLR